MSITRVFLQPFARLHPPRKSLAAAPAAGVARASSPKVQPELCLDGVMSCAVFSGFSESGIWAPEGKDGETRSQPRKLADVIAGPTMYV